MQTTDWYREQDICKHFNLLTNKEKQVLLFIAKGFCTKDIATALELKLREVEMHRYNIKLKLKVRSNKVLVKGIDTFIYFDFDREDGDLCENVNKLSKISKN